MKAVILAIVAILAVASVAGEAYLDGVEDPHFHFTVDPLPTEFLDRSSPWSGNAGSTCTGTQTADCDALHSPIGGCESYYVHKPWKGVDRWVVCQGGSGSCRYRPGNPARNNEPFQQCVASNDAITPPAEEITPPVEEITPPVEVVAEEDLVELRYLDGETDPHFHFFSDPNPADVLDRSTPWSTNSGTQCSGQLVANCDYVTGPIGGSCEDYYVYKPYRGVDRWVICQGGEGIRCSHRPRDQPRNAQFFEQCSNGAYPTSTRETRSRK